MDLALRDGIAPIRAALGDDAVGWLVGGAIRDLVLDRPFNDWDVVVPGAAGDAARAYARRSGGAPFVLSERHGAWRVVDAGRTVDFTALAGTLADDLARRDFTVDAIAVDLSDGSVQDPLGGLVDLEARLLRAVSPSVFRDDPLRLLRLPRLAVELGLAVEAGTAVLARRDAALAASAAGERQLAELSRILAVPDPADALTLCEELGVLTAVLGEVAALRGVVQSRFHHLDVLDHTLHVVDCVADIAGNVSHYFPGAGGVALEASLAEAVDGTTSVALGARWAALLHDIAKPHTRSELPSGVVKFFGHEAAGIPIADAILDRLRASAGLRRLVSTLVGQHLRLGFLAKQRPLGARVVYDYALAVRPYALPSLVVSLGDRLATRGDWTRLRGLRRHHEVAIEMAGALAALGPVPPRLVLPADELARAIGLTPGPALGALVAAVQAEQAAGEVATPADAIRVAEEWLATRNANPG